LNSLPNLDSKHFWIALGLVKAIKPYPRQQLLEVLKTPQEVFSWAYESLKVQPPLDKIRHHLRTFDFSLVDREVLYAKSCGADLIVFDDGAYPFRLKNIQGAPPYIMIRGGGWEQEGPNIFNDLKVLAVVGSRRATSYGRMMTHSLVFPLAQEGCVIVSGGAHGIDAEAHRAALRAKGCTVVVFASGLGNYYPSSHWQLFEKIAQKGALVSEFSFKEKARPYYFPMRNRILSGLSLAFLIA